MLRGDVWQVDLEAVRGSEANKQRPAVIVSNDRANATATRLGRGIVASCRSQALSTKFTPFRFSCRQQRVV
jgi:mRNA interferase MazF